MFKEPQCLLLFTWLAAEKSDFTSKIKDQFPNGLMKHSFTGYSGNILMLSHKLQWFIPISLLSKLKQQSYMILLKTIFVCSKKISKSLDGVTLFRFSELLYILASNKFSAEEDNNTRQIFKLSHATRMPTWCGFIIYPCEGISSAAK